MDQQRLLEYLVEAGPMVIFRRTPADDVTYVSPNVQRLLGYPPSDVLNSPAFWSSKIHPDDRDRFREQADAAFASHAPELERDYRFLHGNGSYRWIHGRAQVEYDVDGAPEALLGYAIDMTDRRESDQQNENFWASSLALMFVAGIDGYFKRVSTGYQRILGWSGAELLARPFVEFVHPEDLPALEASVGAITSGQETGATEELRVLHKDGTYRWLMGSYRADPDEGLIYGMAIDVTERREAEHALAETARRFRAILDSAHEAFISIDDQGVVVDWNHAAERIFGWTRDEMIGSLLADTILPAKHRGDHERGLRRFRETGEAPIIGRHMELEARRKDGAEIPIEFTISRTPLDHSVLFSAFLRDISDRRAAEAALRAAAEETSRAREEAERANEAKSEFLSRMSHDLRTPLNAVLGFAQLLELDLEGQQKEQVGHIVRAGQHLLQLIDEMLDIARIEKGAISLSIEPVRLGDAIGSAVDLIRPLASGRKVHVSVEKSGLDDHVLADRQRLQQVITNLLSNAVKYNREKGTAAISCGRTAHGSIRITVLDSGPGIAPKLLSRLFIPFDRLGAERTSVEGTGIGLSIARRLVELMGGQIEASSTPGVGSRFWVELPAAESPSSELQKLDPPGEALDAPIKTILYVEDNLSNLRLVEAILERRPGVQVIAAMQGSLAVDFAKEHQPDLVLLDVHLPDIDGDEVLRRLQEDPSTRDIPVVAVSAEATPRKVERFLLNGATGYLTKPLDVTRFLDVIDEMLQESD